MAYYGDLMAFTSLKLHEKILERLVKLEFSSPTPIQEQAIPYILEGKDMLASADTGTGKTAAFLLPTVHFLAEKREWLGGPKVLILSPTRELASQIEKEVIRFGASFAHIKSVCVFGGSPYADQIRKLQKPHDILVATPGRLIDLMEKNKVDLSHVDLFIIDEADRMLDMGFVEPVNLIASKTNVDRQTLMFSATLKGAVLKLCQNLMIDPVRVQVEKPECEIPNIAEHFYYTNDISHKHRLLSEILEKDGVGQAIIFTSTKRAADELTDKLNEDGMEAAALHGDMKQRQRDRTIRYLRSGQVRVLVATDVAARGIDVQSITHVINFDLPMQVEDYVHRIGRTGRAGANGEAHSFASRRDRGVIKDIERLTGKKYELFGDSKGGNEGSDDRRSRGSRSGNRSFDREGSARKFGDKPFGERKRFGDRDGGFSGERKRPSFRDRPFAEKKTFGDGERKSFGDGERRSFPDGERKSFGDGERRSFPDGERKSFGDGERRRPPFRDRPFGEKKTFGDGERRSGFNKERSFDPSRPRFNSERSDRAPSDRPFNREKRFSDSGFKAVGGKSDKPFSFGKNDLEFPSKRPARPFNANAPKRGKKVFTSGKKGRF
ncbi:MAG: DEAD/DEAH box helicase [Chlamydiia bacterium]